MTRRLVTALVVVVAVFAGLLLFLVARNSGLLSPFGISSTSNDSQVVRSIENTEEVSLLRLGVEGIYEQDDNREFFGREVPGTSKTNYVRYGFDAKLGLDGEDVDIEETGENKYQITVPRFEFIGYDNLTFEKVVEDNGLLSFVTADPEEYKAVERVLSSAAQAKYVAQNDEILRDQTQAFYNGVILAVDPQAQVTYRFSTLPE